MRWGFPRRLEQSLAATSGHAASELRIGQRFSESNRTKRIPNAALEWRAANVEVKVKLFTWRSDELHDLRQVIAEPAVVQDNPPARKTRGQILLQFLGR
jgi:hypothetical protein